MGLLCYLIYDLLLKNYITFPAFFIVSAVKLNSSSTSNNKESSFRPRRKSVGAARAAILSTRAEGSTPDGASRYHLGLHEGCPCFPQAPLLQPWLWRPLYRPKLPPPIAAPTLEAPSPTKSAAPAWNQSIAPSTFSTPLQKSPSPPKSAAPSLKGPGYPNASCPCCCGFIPHRS